MVMDKIMLTLAIIGALNWGCVGVFKFDVVAWLCTDGTKNACSFLYSAAARVARDLGYHKIITYILDTEDGASLRAAGWHKEADIRGKSWNTPSRPRNTTAPTVDKQRWVREL